MPKILTDDEVYRVNNVWLGPPNATVPFRARYVSWFIGIVLSVLCFAVAKTWFGFGFFVLAWSLIIAVALTRWAGSKITHERGLASVLVMFGREVSTPRRRTSHGGGAAGTKAVRVREHRPRRNASDLPDFPTEPIPAVRFSGHHAVTAAATREAPRA